MKRYKFGSTLIDSAGYDAQRALLEIEFTVDGQIFRYLGVPEEVWYRFKRGPAPEAFFHGFIKGCYAERRVWPSS
jgi:hypothetical protein